MRYMIVVLSILLSTNMAFAGYSDMSDGLDTSFANGHYLKLDQSSAQTVTGGAPIFSSGVAIGDGTATVTQAAGGDIQFTDSVTGTKTLAQLAAGGGGVTDHSDLNELDYASSGHTGFEPALGNPGTNDYILSSKTDGTRSWVAPTVSSVTSVFGRTGDVVATQDDYTWAQIDKTTSDLDDLTTKSHTSLTDIGTNTHDDIDTHIADTSIHTEDNLLVHLAGAETITGKKLFNTELPESAIVPSEDNDLTNKAYVDAFAQGLIVKDSCGVATTEAETLASDFENGDTIDGVVLVTGDRVLIKNQASAVENGIYTVNASGAPTRATDYDSDAEVLAGTFTYIIEGTENENTQWVQYEVDPEVGVDPLNFRALPAPLVLTASNGVKKVSDDFQIDLSDTNPSLEVSDGGLRAKVDDSTIERTASGLAVKDSGITNAKIGETITVANGGTALTAVGTANQVLGTNATATGLEYKSIVGGSNVTVTHTAGQAEISASVSGVADYLYSQIMFHSHLSSSYTWTNMPAATTAIAIYQRANLTGAVQYRICTHQAVAGYSTATLNLQYSTDGSNWYACDTSSAGALAVGAGTGLKTGAWANLVAGGAQDVRLRIVGQGGDGVVDPQFRELWVEVKYNASIVSLVSSDTVDKEITVHSHPASALAWTNMPAAVTEFISVYARQRADLSNCTTYRIAVSQSVAGKAGADLNLQYSLDGTTWVAADSVSGAGELDVGTGTGFKTGSWAALKDAAKGDVYLRLVGKDGDGIVDPAWRQVKIQFREHTYGQGTTGNDTEVLFNDGGATGTDAGLTYNKTTDTLNVNYIAPVSGDTVKVSPSANSYFELTEKTVEIDEVEEPITLSLPYLTGVYVLGEETGEILALCPNVGIYQHDAEETNCGISFLSSDLAYQSSITYNWSDVLPYFAFGAGIIPNGSGEENFLGTTSSPWYDFHVGNYGNTRIDISSVTDPVTEITGTFMQISAENVSDLLILKAPVMYYSTADYTTYSNGSYNFTDGLFGRSTLSTDNSGNSKLNMHNGIDSSAYRTGTINEYGTGCFEINSGGFYNLTNSATYSGANNLNIINAGTYHYLVNSATYTPTGGSKVGIINVANFFALQESTASYDAGAISSLGNTLLYGTLSTSGSAYEADSINAWCIIEGFSTASTHNSSIVDRSSYPVIWGADNKALRFGAGYTGTSGQFETYGDAELYYDGTDFICNPKRIGSGVFSVVGDEKVGDATSSIYLEQVTDPSSSEITFTGTFSQLRADNSTDYLFMKAPVAFYGDVPTSLIDGPSLKITSLIGATGDISTDMDGSNDKINVNSCMFAQLTRKGTIDGYGTGDVDLSISYSFGLANDATYSGSNDLVIENFGVYGLVECTSTYSTTGEIATVNAGANFDILTDPTLSNIDDISVIKNHVIQGAVENISGSYTTHTMNAFAYITPFTTDCTHNVAIFDESGYPNIIASDNAPLRFGAGDTNAPYYDTYGDAELYYDGTDFICNPDRIGSGDFKVLGSVNATSYKAGGTAPVADGTYTVGARLTPSGTDGTITVKGGIITAVQQAT